MSEDYPAVVVLDQAQGLFGDVIGSPTVVSHPYHGAEVEWIGLEARFNCLGNIFNSLRIHGRLWAGRRDGQGYFPRETRLFINDEVRMILNDIPDQQDVYSIPVDQLFGGPFERNVSVKLVAYAPCYWSPAQDPHSELRITPKLG